jgi:hypothetical protein
MANEDLGRKALGADAAYCGAIGAVCIAASRPLAKWTGLPVPAVAGIGAGAAAWSGFVARSASQRNWQSGIRVVAAANVVAAGGLALAAKRRSRLGMRLALAGTAFEVGAFAAVQIASLIVPGTDEDESAS